MTGKTKKPLMDHDPLEWVNADQDGSDVAIEQVELTAEKACEEVAAMGSEMNQIRLEEREKLDRVAELQELLLQALDKNADITVDASAVKLIDAAAMQLLVLFFQQAVKQGQAVTIIEPSQSFSEAAGLLGLRELFGI